MTKKIRAVIFDWGDTLMRDFPQSKGAMAYWEKVEVIPDIKDALEKVSSEYICCVASNAGNSSAELMGVALNRVEIQKYFQYFFTSRELGVTKPNLEFFDNIIRKLNLRHEECIMVGNDYEKDIVPAIAIGINTILYNKESKEVLNNDADFTISSMKELYEVIIGFENHNRANFV
ncbi:HAD family hydrolase [Gracilibacillus sp. D59]|uniref:HAD family hydrolase n=1 Tax=Gracilibacillus sp. D59 TaxID=3457434 RepID=UPI003FCE16BE